MNGPAPHALDIYPCKKCGSQQHTIRYHSSSCPLVVKSNKALALNCYDDSYWRATFTCGPHIHAICLICGYEWHTLPLDEAP